MKKRIKPIFFLFFSLLLFTNIIKAENTLQTSSIDITFELNGGSILPEGYTLLEYIESDGTQTIDVQIPVTEKTKIISILSVLDKSPIGADEEHILSKDYNLLGTYGSWTGLALSVREGSFRFWSKSQLMTDAKYINEVPYKAILNDNGNYSINEINYLENTIPTANTTNIMIFTARHNTALDGLKNSAMRLYQMIIEEDGNIISYLIPAKNDNNILGLYDIKRNMFLTTLGTTNFISGKELTTYTRTYVERTKLEEIPIPTKPYNTFLGWYQDSNYTIPIAKDTIVSNSIKTIYAKWLEHPHNYNNIGVVNNQIGNICECGQIDPNNILSIDIPKEIIYDGTSKEISLINTLGISNEDYEIIYKQKDIDGTYKEISSLPKHTGDYIVILKYNNQEITKEFKIIREIVNPNTSNSTIPFTIILFLVAPTILILVTFNKYKTKVYRV